jgi:hypothetical protein
LRFFDRKLEAYATCQCANYRNDPNSTKDEFRASAGKWLLAAL